jgi:hypothetical protein
VWQLGQRRAKVAGEAGRQGVDSGSWSWEDGLVPFIGDVVVKPFQPEGKRWLLVEPFSYQGKTDRFDVPKDFSTDFASVPRVFVWLLPRYGRWTQAAILHDYLWKLAREGKLEKFDADGLFNRAMRELGVPYLRRWIMWTAVRWAAGPRSWFARGPVPFVRMVVISLPTLLVVAVPAIAVLAALLVGALAELLAYLPLRVAHRDKTKQVNPPEARDVLSAG